MKRALAIGSVAAAVVACASTGGGGDFRSMTCRDWLKLADSDDPIGSGVLDVANDYLDSTRIDPRNGARDVSDLADVISSVCGAKGLHSVRIVLIKPQVVRIFLSEHPKDRD